MSIFNIKIANNLLEKVISRLERDGEDVRTLEVYKADLEEKIESKSISTFSKLSKLKKLNDNQQLVLDTLKKDFCDEYIFDNITDFTVFCRMDYPEDSDIRKEATDIYFELNKQEEIEVLKHFIEYLENKEEEVC